MTDKTVGTYQTSRLNEGASPKTINEEVSFLLRLSEHVMQAGAIRAQLASRNGSKLKVNKRVGKAFTKRRKIAIVNAGPNLEV